MSNNTYINRISATYRDKPTVALFLQVHLLPMDHMAIRIRGPDPPTSLIVMVSCTNRKETETRYDHVQIRVSVLSLHEFVHPDIWPSFFIFGSHIVLSCWPAF